jgi:hypothetical protein
MKQKIQEAIQKKNPAPPQNKPAPPPTSKPKELPGNTSNSKTSLQSYLQSNMQSIPSAKSTCWDAGRLISKRFYSYGGRRLYCFLSGLSNFKQLESISGVPVFKSGPHSDYLDLNSKKSFGHYNPQFLKWVSEKVMPILLAPSFRKANQGIFDDYLKVPALTFYKSFYFAMSNPENFSKMIKLYETKLNSPNGFTEGAYPLFREAADNIWDPLHCDSEAVLFWVRRSIDGSFRSFSGMLLQILDVYAPDDLKKLESIAQKYPRKK